MGAEFNTGDPLAYFITWTTYGTWLPGDERGWKRKKCGEIQPPNPALKAISRNRMTDTPFEMTIEDRSTVASVVKKHCEVRGWNLYVVNPRSNHVHVVVAAPGYDAKTVRSQFQAWCTRTLKLRYPNRKHFWTEGGSGRFVNSETELERVVLYASEAQDRKDLEYE